MADRRVKVSIVGDVSDYTAALARAAAATRALGEAAAENAKAVRTESAKAAAANKALGDSAAESARTVGASSEQASRKIAEVRRQLVELARTKTAPGVKVDTVAARMELSRLQAELADIDRSDTSPRVDAETAAAEAQLRTVQAQLNRIDGQTVTAHVNVDDRGTTAMAASRISGLASAAIALSPVLGAVGAAAVAGLGAIVPLAATGAAGLGVLAIGFSGVSDAVKLLDQRQEAVASSAAQSAASQVSSARQIESAQSSLANAQANAAAGAITAQERVLDAERNVAEARRDAAESVSSAQRRAAEAVASAVQRYESAERALSGAQRDGQRAQEDLTRARIDAAEEMEDIQLRVRGGVLAERQAILDLAEAQKELNEIPADASAAEREQMVLDLERAKLRVDELKESNGDLSVEQSEWARTGVEGSRQVQDAQERVADAQRGVEDAARAVGDAAAEVDKARIEGAAEVARAERDGAEKIADAQRQVASAVRAQSEQQRQSAASVESAQRAVEAAMAAVGTTGAAALTKIEDKLADVNPHTLAFASYVRDIMVPAFEDLRSAAAAGLLPGVQEGFETLRPHLSDVNDFVGSLSEKFGELAVEGAEALTDPFWMDFFRVIELNAIPLMDNLFRGLGNVAGGFAGISTAFMPMARDLSDGILEMTRDFQAWSAELGESEGFRTFQAYIQENWPKVQELLGNLASTIGDLIEAGAPIGSVMLTGFVALTEVLNALPVEVVQALLTAFIGYRAVTGVADLINGIATSFGAVQTAAGRIGGIVPGVQTSFGQMSAAADPAAASITGVGGAADGTRGKLGSFTSFLGGPWGIALGAASIGLSALVGWLGRTDEAAQATKAWQDQLRGAFEQSNGVIDANVRQLAAKKAVETEVGDTGENVLDVANRLGLSLPTVTDAILGQGDAFNNLVARLKETVEQETYVQEAGDGSRIVLTEQGEAAKGLLEQLNVLAPGVQGATEDQRNIAAATGDTTRQLETQRTTMELLVASADEQLSIYNELLMEKATKDAEAAAATEAAMGAATTSWETHVANADVSLDEYAARLDEDVANKDAWREDIKAVTERGGVEVGAALLAMGEEGKRLADDLANATDEDFRRMADAMINHARNGGAQAAWEMDQAMKIMTVVSREGGKAAAGEVSKELGIGVADVARIAAGYGINLANGINPVLTAIGAKAINTAPGMVGVMADGGVMDFYANGGVSENHVAQIAPAGAWRVWAEEETGGEAYIPLAPSKRQRSMDIWEETGKRLGVDMEYFANGGQIFNVTRAVFPRAKLNSAYRPGDPGYHGKDQAADLGEAGFAGGAGRPYIADMNRWWTDNYGRTAAEIIYNGLGDDRMNIKNGAPLAYSAAVQAQHRNHLHVAYPAALSGATGGPAGVALTAAVPAPVRTVMPPVPTFPHNAIAGSAVATSTHARNEAQAVADKHYDTQVANAAAANAASGAFTPVAATGPVQDIVRAAMVSRGWNASPQWDALARLIQKESSWNPNAQNPTSTAYGLFQFLNSTWAGTGIAKTSNPALQAEAGARYIASRYKTPSAALAFHNANNWYDDGGVAKGRGLMLKNVIAPERTLSPRQTDAFEQMVAREFSGASGGSTGGWDGQLPPIEVQARVFVGDREITDIVRVESNAVIDQRDAARGRDWRSARG